MLKQKLLTSFLPSKSLLLEAESFSKVCLSTERAGFVEKLKERDDKYGEFPAKLVYQTTLLRSKRKAPVVFVKSNQASRLTPSSSSLLTNTKQPHTFQT